MEGDDDSPVDQQSILSQVFATLATLPTRTESLSKTSEEIEENAEKTQAEEMSKTEEYSAETTDSAKTEQSSEGVLPLSELLPSKVPKNGDSCHACTTSILSTLISTTSCASSTSNARGTAALPPSSSGLIKCPTYCRSNCVVQHHPLLVAILNCVDTEEMELMDMKLGVLDSVIGKYRQSSLQWQCDDVIPDVLQDYRYPMIHWACMLGRVGAAVWLIGHKYSRPTAQAMTHNAETGIHKALLSLQTTCAKNALRKFVQLLSVMEPALSVRDKDGNTPMHLCAQMLQSEMPKSDFFRDCLLHMVAEMNTVRSRDDVAAVLNTKNAEGNTALHILCRSAKCGPHIRYLVSRGASPIIANNKGETSVDIAKQGNLQNIFGFLKTGLKYVVESQGPASSIRLADPSDDCSTTVTTDANELTGTDSTLCPESSMSDTGPAAKKPKGEYVTLMGDKITAMGKLEDLKQRSTPSPPPPLSPIRLFNNPCTEDSAIQQFFEEVTKEPLDSEKTCNKQPKSPSSTMSEFQTLLQEEKYEEVAAILKMVCQNKNEENLPEYLRVLKEAGSVSHSKVIDALLQSRDQALTNLSYANKSIECLQHKFREAQKRQSTLVMDIMVIVDNLGDLQREETNLNKDIAGYEEKAAKVEATNSHLRERLSNCQEAIHVLKRLHREAAVEKRRAATVITSSSHTRN